MVLANPITFLGIVMLSTIVSYYSFFLGGKWFRKFWLLDNPGPYGHDRDPVPFGFGLLLYLNFVAVCVICIALGYMEITDKLLVLIILWALVTGLSFVDDLDTIFKFDRSEKSAQKFTMEDLWKIRKTGFAISPKVRLAMQILVGLIVGLTSIKISYISNIFWGILYLDFFSVSLFWYEVFLIPLFFTIFWYVLVFNSVNWSDGVPGLTIWLTTITLFIILISTIRFYLLDTTPALRQNAMFVFGILSILLPSLIWAWYYNLTPKMLLGDSGTMFLAFMIASLAILVGGKVATVATALWVYLVDAIYVIFARISNKKNPLKWDRIHHLHYRLKAIGMSDAFIRNFVYSIALFFGISAVFLDKIGKVLLFIALIIVIVFITKILSLKTSSKWGFSLIELLIVTIIIATVSVVGFKTFSTLEESNKNAFVQRRIQTLIQEMDRKVAEGVISDYSMRFFKDAPGIIVDTNTYRVHDSVRLDYNWNIQSGVLTFSGATKPGFALISENRTYYREMRNVPANTIAFTMSGTFDIPQQIVTADDATQKNTFFVYPLDTEISGTKFLSTIALPNAMTGVTLKNMRSQKSIYDASGASYTGVTLDIFRWDSKFSYVISSWK